MVFSMSLLFMWAIDFVMVGLLKQDGYEATSVSDIAGELDMTKGALHKQAAKLLAAHVERCIEKNASPQKQKE